ncbi:MAG: arsenate reductase ArsC [Gallionellaceae bacterium]|nr:arsenate reductase ArsC [Gallionellaceae bacterium]
MQKIYNVLFLCTGNSARSVLAESALNHLGGGHFRAYSAGSKPSGKVHPASLRLLQRMGLSSAGLRSKSWDEFAASDAPQMDFIFTVCDNAVGEECPLWLGSPVTAHWGVEDPAACTGSEAEQDKVFEQVYQRLNKRIQLFISLPLAKLDALSLRQRLQEIGRS